MHYHQLCQNKDFFAFFNIFVTFVSQSEAAHLREFLEGFEADESPRHLEAHDSDLVLLDEPRPNSTLLSGLLVHQADQCLQQFKYL